MNRGRAGAKAPRVVLVTRKTLYQQLVERHGTPGQARFYLQSRGESIREYEEAHERFEVALAQVAGALDTDQRRVRVDRDELDRFLFAEDDLVVIVGQDGLVPNAAKYLSGQIVIGINPDPDRYDGVLCNHPPPRAGELLRWAAGGPSEDGVLRIQRRVMAAAEREDGQRLLALNEVFVGHRTHQSARYRLRAGDRRERQSSSGLICSTGTGGTGWARSIAGQRRLRDPLPAAEEPALAWFVREPFPSVATGVELNYGKLRAGQKLEVLSEMSEGGVIFADGIESDRLEFLSGQRVEISVAEQTLNLVVPVDAAPPAQAPARPARGLGQRRG